MSSGSLFATQRSRHWELCLSPILNDLALEADSEARILVQDINLGGDPGKSWQESGAVRKEGVCIK